MGEPLRAGRSDASNPSFGAYRPKNFLQPCLLLLLHEEPAYGYQLRERLRPFKTGAWDQGTIYRFLNSMEAAGLVTSCWERSASGPQRRRYRLTAAGRRALADWARGVESICDLLLRFSARYREEGDHAAHLDGRPEPHPAGARDIDIVGVPSPV